MKSICGVIKSHLEIWSILYGFLFNFTLRSIQDIFRLNSEDFDVSGDEELDYKEFKMFA